MVNTAGGVLHDQGEADEDMSAQDRLILAGGSTIEGASGMIDNKAVSKAVEETGREGCSRVHCIPCVGSRSGIIG